jgi:hypothetical protein
VGLLTRIEVKKMGVRLFWREGTGSSEVGPPGMTPRGWTRDVNAAEARDDGVTVDIGPKVAMAVGGLGILSLLGYGVYRASK